MLNMSAVQLQYMRQCGHVHRQVGMRACQQTSAEDVTKPSTSLRGCMQVCVCVCNPSYNGISYIAGGARSLLESCTNEDAPVCL